MLKLENSIRGLSFSRVAFDLTIQVTKIESILVHKLEEIKMADDIKASIDAQEIKEVL